jgi:hypothetical protein
MAEEKAFTFGSMGGAKVGEANLIKKVGKKRAKELLERIAEATMPKMKKRS